MEIHNGDVLVEVKNLVKYFPIRGGITQRVVGWVKAVDGVHFQVRKGETLALVGESGCGKTTLGHTLLRLLEPTSGSVYFEGIDLGNLGTGELKEMRRNMQIIFQDPSSALDPRMTIGESIGEGLRIHGIRNKDERYAIVIDLLKKVGLEETHFNRFPHEFSGGQRQRIGIARAIALKPKFIVADEPVSALDVSIQAQVLNILKNLQDEFNLTILFIAHDLGVVEHIADRVAVMYLGKIVELAPKRELFANPLHPYTQALMSAIPVPNPTYRRQRIILRGELPSAMTPPAGCRFHPRCPAVMDHCSASKPRFIEVSPEHFVACWRVE
ncbi:MAG: ATP-binding cassette domain-containing protein [Chloroflexi bacterium]|nr:ATP-binding cassette domain-containing protein [Chloroflexota bacterium]